MHHELDWFIAIAEAENLTAAGEQVRVSQPTLSRFVGRLEADLGVELFDRHGRGMIATEAGRKVLDKHTTAWREMAGAIGQVLDLS